MRKLALGCLALTWLIPNAQAIPNIDTLYGKNKEGYARVKVVNLTTRNLACYVALDGRKIKFKLAARAQSKWYKATDKRFTYKSFSIWCDYIELHPEYERYTN